MREQVYTVRNQKIYVTVQGEDASPVIVLLHGFTGTTATWDELTAELHRHYKVVAVDLTGHGKTMAPNDSSRYAMAAQIADLEDLFEQMELTNFVLLGYSMGGRIALSYTINYPQRVQSLILESASPGLKTADARRERQQADALLAARIEREGMPAFVDFWEGIPLFASQKQLSPEKRAAVRKERLGQNPVALSNSLKGIGTGSQPSYWDELPVLHIPVLLITGEIDRKFVFIAREMDEILPFSKQIIVQDAGHAIHVEKPTLFATIVEDHIKKLII